MPKEKAGRNKTIDISVEEGQQYLERCISVNNKVELSDILDLIDKAKKQGKQYE